MGWIGLGLSITRHLVVLHGGMMKLDSQPNQGSIFHIYLPLPALSQSKSTKQDDPAPFAGQVPVIVLSNKMPGLEDVKRKEGHTHVTLQSKGIWSEE